MVLMIRVEKSLRRRLATAAAIVLAAAAGAATAQIGPGTPYISPTITGRINAGPPGRGPMPPGRAGIPGRAGGPAGGPRRPDGTICQQVDITDLPSGAEVQWMMWLMSTTGGKITPEERAIVSQCYLQTLQGANGKTFAASPDPDSIDQRVFLLIRGASTRWDLMSVVDDPAYSRLTLTADPKGTLKLYIPREDVSPFQALGRGFTQEAFGLRVAVKNPDGSTAQKSNVFLVSFQTYMGNAHTTLAVDRSPLKDAVSWSDGANAPVFWDGKKFATAGQRR